MPVATKLQSPVPDSRGILGLGGNRIRVLEAPKGKSESLKKPQRPKKLMAEISDTAVKDNVSVDSSCSSDSSLNGSLAKMASSKKMPSRRNGLKPMKIVPDGVEVSPKISGPSKRCDWITASAGKSVQVYLMLSYL